MHRKLLKETVKKALEEGYSEKEIKKILKEKKWPVDHIHETITEIKKETPVKKSIKYELKLIKFSIVNKILLLLLIILVIIALFYYKFETNCNTNEACFNELASQCQKAHILIQREGNTFEYTILGKEKDNFCLVNIKITQLNQQYDEETKGILENKEMICHIPREKLSSLTETEAVIDYCTGPLKEAMYELIIKNIYGVLAENIGPVLGELGSVKSS